MVLATRALTQVVIKIVAASAAAIAAMVLIAP
jgi:hypothetical protein